MNQGAQHSSSAAAVTRAPAGCSAANAPSCGAATVSQAHGTWYYQIELPPRASGTRRPPLRHGGFATHAGAQAELDLARELLAIAPPGDPQTAIRIADAITAAICAEVELPDPARVRKQVGAGRDPAVRPPTVGEWARNG